MRFVLDANIAVAALNGAGAVQRIAALRRSITVVNLDDRIVDLYGSIRATLERRGIVKSDFDLLIACTALGQDAILVTNDQGLLDAEIEGLRTENWLAPRPAGEPHE